MGNWLAYGSTWFSMEVPDAKSEAEAKMAVLNKLMTLGIKMDVKELEAEPKD